MTEKVPVLEINTLRNIRKEKEQLQTLFDEIQQGMFIPTAPAENEVCVKRYREWISVFRKAYREALQKENLDEVYAFNRKMGPVIQKMHQSACAQEHAAFYAMGMFNGVFVGMSDMLPQRNNEQIFNVQMAELRERAYVKQIIKILYEGGCVQHKQMCDKINISASQLTRSMSDLIEAGCVKRYRSGKASIYMLTAMGERYAREFLGYKRINYSEYAQVRLAGKKPQIEQKKRHEITGRSNQAEAYNLSNNEGKVRREKRLWVDSVGEESMAYE